MYTPDELAAIKAVERKIDTEYDAEHRRQRAEYRAQREATFAARRAQYATENSELEARLAAIRERLAREARMKRYAQHDTFVPRTRTAVLMWYQTYSDDEPASF